MSYPDTGDLFEYMDYTEDPYDRRDAVGRIPAVTLDTIEGNADEDYPYGVDYDTSSNWSF